MTPDLPAAFPLDHLPLCGRPGATGLNAGRVNFSYAWLEEKNGCLAAALLALGLQPGERVASWLPKSPMACLMPLAAARAGLVHVPINPALKPQQLAHILDDSGAGLLVSQDARLTAAASFIPLGCNQISETELFEKANGQRPVPPSAWDVDRLCALLYTSGSTGRPKGVMVSHANLTLGAISVARYLGLDEADKVLAVLPLSFDYGQNQLLSTWYAGGQVIALDYLSPRDIIQAVDRHGITTLAGIPPLWTQLCEAAWPAETAARLKRLTNSGGALSEALVRRMQALFSRAQIVPMYGLTEAFRSTYLPPDLVHAHPTSMGRAIPFAEVLAVREDGSQTADGEAGELVHAGPLVAQGYWRQPEATAERFRAAPDWSVFGGTAVWSGDIVRRDVDGLFHFVGRKDGMIKSSGNRISPTEIEEAAFGGAAIWEALAFGVPDAHRGEAIILAVRGDPAQEEQLAKHLRAMLPSFMQPSKIIWTDSLARNPNGKLDRLAIRSAYLVGEWA